MSDKLTSLTFHLAELKNRVIKCLVATALMFLISYICGDKILLFFLKPLMGITKLEMIAITITEMFFVKMNLAMIVAMCTCTPWYLLQTYLFIVPALEKKENTKVFFFFLAFVALFVIGDSLLYYGILPNAIQFLSEHSQSQVANIKLYIRVEEYINSVLKLFFAFGLAFQLPVILILLSITNIIKASHLSNFRRFAIVIIFIISAIATPPDVPSQIILATALIALYEITIIIIKRIEARKTKKTITSNDTNENLNDIHNEKKEEKLQDMNTDESEKM